MKTRAGWYFIADDLGRDETAKKWNEYVELEFEFALMQFEKSLAKHADFERLFPED